MSIFKILDFLKLISVKAYLFTMVIKSINDKLISFVSWSEKSSNIETINKIKKLEWEISNKNTILFINENKIKGLKVLQTRCQTCENGIYNINTSRLKQFINGKDDPPFMCRSCSIKKNKKKQDWNHYKKIRKENWNKKSEEEKEKFSKKVSNAKMASYKNEDLNVDKFIVEYKKGQPLYKIKYLVGNSTALAKKILKENDIKIRNQSDAQKLSIKENPFSKKEVKERLKKIRRKKFFENLLSSERLNNKVQPLFEYSDYKTVDSMYKWKCKNCETIFEDHLDDGRIPRCPNCFPRNYNESSAEKEIVEYVKSLGIKNIVENDKEILNGKELDIYLPDHDIAIEFNGIYWHSEISGKNKNYHLNKTIECENKNIQLIHIFEDEWVEKKEIIKSIIKSKVKLDNKIYGRKCLIKKLNNSDIEYFYNTNHIQGHVNSNINIGLFYNNELVSCISFGKSRFNRKYDWEITRYANKLGLSVIGGFAKLLKYFRKNYSGSIITYADRRLFNGKTYENNGFNKLKSSSPGYHYTDHKSRYNRVQFQKHKLEKKLKYFDPNLTEWENMQINGWDRIWDCGNNVFVLK